PQTRSDQILSTRIRRREHDDICVAIGRLPGENAVYAIFHEHVPVQRRTRFGARFRWEQDRASRDLVPMRTHLRPRPRQPRSPPRVASAQRVVALLLALSCYPHHGRASRRLRTRRPYDGTKVVLLTPLSSV